MVPARVTAEDQARYPVPDGRRTQRPALRAGLPWSGAAAPAAPLGPRGDGLVARPASLSTPRASRAAGREPKMGDSRLPRAPTAGGAPGGRSRGVTPAVGAAPMAGGGAAQADAAPARGRWLEPKKGDSALTSRGAQAWPTAHALRVGGPATGPAPGAASSPGRGALPKTGDSALASRGARAWPSARA